RFDLDNLMVVSPDVGGVVRTRDLGNRIGADLAIVDKRRPRAGESEVMNIIGEVSGRHCLLVDDIVDSAGTLCNAAAALRKAGAISVSAYVTHGVLSGEAVERVSGSDLEKLLITDTIQPTQRVLDSDKFAIIEIADLMGEAIKRISGENSVSSLFD
ncbi:MAG: ribose-phosphate diphosphokinase, partial [Alphaproteobacteria bacterium]|nr:ribose-phosphate diphosphokinase [Alphaproteobacteria bacterium]